MVNEYYVYAWYFKSNNEIFYIGKGKGDRCHYTGQYRNDYFKSIINKYPDDVEVKKLSENISNEDACRLERQLIKEYHEKGQCKANFHEGGLGGYTGNYTTVSQKMKEYSKIRNYSVENNPNYGKKWSDEKRKALSEKMHEKWKNSPETFLTEKRKNREFHPWNKGKETKLLYTNGRKGVKITPEQYKIMMNRDCPYLYQVYFDNRLVYWTISSAKLISYCKETFKISRAIISKLIADNWKPTFNKHKHLESLKIIRTNRSVSTNRDECSDVEWRLQPPEVPGNLNN